MLVPTALPPRFSSCTIFLHSTCLGRRRRQAHFAPSCTRHGLVLQHLERTAHSHFTPTPSLCSSLSLLPTTTAAAVWCAGYPPWSCAATPRLAPTIGQARVAEEPRLASQLVRALPSHGRAGPAVLRRSTSCSAEPPPSPCCAIAVTSWGSAARVSLSARSRQGVLVHVLLIRCPSPIVSPPSSIGPHPCCRCRRELRLPEPTRPQHRRAMPVRHPGICATLPHRAAPLRPEPLALPRAALFHLRRRRAIDWAGLLIPRPCSVRRRPPPQHLHLFSSIAEPKEGTHIPPSPQRLLLARTCRRTRSGATPRSRKQVGSRLCVSLLLLA